LPQAIAGDAIFLRHGGRAQEIAAELADVLEKRAIPSHHRRPRSGSALNRSRMTTVPSLENMAPQGDDAADAVVQGSPLYSVGAIRVHHAAKPRLIA